MKAKLKKFIVLFLVVSCFVYGLTAFPVAGALWTRNECELDMPLNEGEGLRAIDYSGKDRVGIITDASWDDEDLRFDGLGDYVTVDLEESNIISDPSGNNITWSFTFILFNIYGVNRRYIVSSGGQTTSAGFGAVVNSDEKMWIGFNTNSSHVSTGYTIDITVYQWYTAVVTFNGASAVVDQEMTVYLNGELIGTYEAESGGYSNNNEDLTIGRPNKKFDNYWYGYIKDIKVFSGIHQPVLTLPMNEGEGTTVDDYSGNEFDGTITGASWDGNELYFNGYGDYVTVDGITNPIISNPTGYDVTWEFSFKAFTEWDKRYIVSSGGQTDSTGFAAVLNTNDQMWLGFKDTSCSVSTGYTIDITLNEWHTIVATFRGSEQEWQKRVMKVYLDGKPVGTYFPVFGTYTDKYTKLKIGIGNKEPAYPYYWDGYIKDVKVYAGLADSIPSPSNYLSTDWARTLHQDITTLAEELIEGNTSNDYDKAQAIQFYVERMWNHGVNGTDSFIRDYEIYSDPYYDDENKLFYGRCWYSAVLASSLCRAVDIPSRIIYIHTEGTDLSGETRNGNYHWTSEVFINNDWLPLDVNNAYGWFDKDPETISDLNGWFGSSGDTDIYIVSFIHSSGAYFSYYPGDVVTLINMSIYDPSQFQWYQNATSG